KGTCESFVFGAGFRRFRDRRIHKVACSTWHLRRHAEALWGGVGHGRQATPTGTNPACGSLTRCPFTERNSVICCGSVTWCSSVLPGFSCESETHSAPCPSGRGNEAQDEPVVIPCRRVRRCGPGPGGEVEPWQIVASS